jgi:hypothetical protein
MSESPTQRQAIKRLLSLVLAEVRPEEVLLVDHIFDEPRELDQRTGGLGWGGAVAGLLWIDLLLPALRHLAKATSDGFGKKWGERLAEWLWPKKSAPKPLDPEALTKVRLAMVEHLAAQGVPSQDCARVGDSVVAVLVGKPELLRQIVGA